MAYHIERTGDIVFDTFQAGIADAPEQGIAMIRNINLISIPGEGSVNFKTSAINVPPIVIGASCTFTGSTDVVNWTPIATLYTDCAVIFSSSTGGVTAGVIYWLANVSGGTFKVYTDIGHTQLVDLSDASNTFSTVTYGQPTYKALDTLNGYIFELDLNGRAWWINGSGDLTYLGNTTLTSTHGNGITVDGAYLLIWRDVAIDYLPISEITANNAPNWVYTWKTTNLTSNSSVNAHSHYAITAQDNAVYFCNDKFVGSIVTIGGQAFNPADPLTYTYLPQALALPSIELAVCLAELNSQLLVGGIQNKIYSWDRVSTSFIYPLFVGENYTTRMVTTNSNTYIFSGNRGRIYQTNGSNISLFKKIPDHIVLDFGGSLDPYFTWLDAIYWKNQLYFSFLTAKNDGTVITNLGGLWGIDVSLNIVGTPTSVALRMTNTLSSGAASYPYVISPNIRSTTPAGAGLYVSWVYTGPTYGVDVTTSNPYDVNSAVLGEIYTDLVPTGTAINPETFHQIEFKLSAPLVAGERVRIYSRQNYSQSWTNLVGTTTTVGALSDNFPVNFQQGQWIQLFAELASTSTTPSYTRLVELRIKRKP